MKSLRYRLEAGAVRVLFALFRAFPLSIASRIGGVIARSIGPFMPVHQVAVRNLQRALPELSEAERRATLRGMWDNLGRLIGEYPHLNSPAILHCVKEETGLQHFKHAYEAGKPILLISGHLGNWELPAVVSARHGIKLHLLYRGANNPAVDAIIASIRSRFALGLHDKGAGAGRAVLKAIRSHEPVGLLVDQKVSDGIAVPLFGEAAMTGDAVAQLVLKYQPVVLPARCVRLHGCQFRIAIEAPMQFEISGDEYADTREIMRQIHGVLERWIREDPAQWFWVHKRWPFSKKKTA